MLDLEVTAEASADLDEILRYSGERFGESVAGRYFDVIEQTMGWLRDYPGLGTVDPRITPPVRYAEAGSHRIFYSHRDDRIIVWRLLHGKIRAQGRVRPV